MIEELINSRVLILGCGNTLFGDDGFGPEVILALEQEAGLPPGVTAFDVGTSVSDLLFDLALSPDKPEQIILVDAVSLPDQSPGQLEWLPLTRIPQCKKADFSMHQFPSIDLLQELAHQAGVDVRILAVQVGYIPDHVQPGLTAEVRAAVPAACRMIRSAV
ncbi:MAG: hydrogenase maturation protease [Desulfovermiculus sp.]